LGLDLHSNTFLVCDGECELIGMCLIAALDFQVMTQTTMQKVGLGWAPPLILTDKQNKRATSSIKDSYCLLILAIEWVNTALRSFSSHFVSLLYVSSPWRFDAAIHAYRCMNGWSRLLLIWLKRNGNKNEWIGDK
jgi:hypothetical protein